VGEVLLGAVNEVSVPLDANNIPRAPNPETPTPTGDTASLRLIIHVDATGRASLLKHVAILARKDGAQETESDLALVTNERLYGQFPPQAAMRISSAGFDFGDPKANAAVNQLVTSAAAAASTAATVNGATIASVKSAVLAALTPLLAPADATARFNTFLQNHLNSGQVQAIAAGGPTNAAISQAEILRDGSFYQDTRGLEMIQAITNGIATVTPEEKNQVALNIAASFAETNDNYERYLSGEILGDMIASAALLAASSSASLPLLESTAFAPADGGAAVIVTSPAHGLSTGDEIAIQQAPVNAYNKLHTITRIDDNSFKISAPHIAGGSIISFSGATATAPLVVVSPGHGLSGETKITLRNSLSSYNGNYIATPLGSDAFSIPIPFAGNPPTKGTWASRSGNITGYAGTSSGTSGIKITSPAHGLNNGQSIEIFGSGTPTYNGTKTITRIDANNFSINQPFIDNPSLKGSWDVPIGITQFSPPSITPTQIESPAHGLQTGDAILISEAGYAPYNGEQIVDVVDSDTFNILVSFNIDEGNPSEKGTWKISGTSKWRPTAPTRLALSSTPKVTAALAEAARIRVAAYSDTRAVDATQIVLDAILTTAATHESLLTQEVASDAETAGREALLSSVPRFPSPTQIPSADYDEFVRSSTYAGAASLAAEAAATAAMAEKENVIATSASISDKAQAAALTALTPVFSQAARTLLTSLPMDGDFGAASAALSTEILLPANHPTNPFRHRRHPDHTVGFDIRRIVSLTFDDPSGVTPGRAGYGVDRISGTYDEEIFGLHKPLGPTKSIGLKVRGSFKLNRISLIDTLNGK
jgi:hypothetical protein